MLRAPLVASLMLLPTICSIAAAQRRTPPEKGASPGDQISVTIAAKIGKTNYQGSGPGTCRHAADASIHGTSASLWMVQYESGKGKIKRLDLTLWRPKDGDGDQLSLSLEIGSSTHRIVTGGEGESAGEGTVTILPSGPGGRLEVSGKEASGKPIQLSIECSAFADVPSEGG
jgi:hypothetical protein